MESGLAMLLIAQVHTHTCMCALIKIVICRITTLVIFYTTSYFDTFLLNTELPPLTIRLVNGSPRYNGSSIFIDFITTQPITSATCYLGNQRLQDCTLVYVHWAIIIYRTFILSLFCSYRLGFTCRHHLITSV